MGRWGNKFFDNDYAMDIKDESLKLIETHLSIKDITKKLKKTFLRKNCTVEEINVFWIVISIIFWENRIKDNEIYTKGIKSIQSYRLLIKNNFNNEEILEELNQFEINLTSISPKIERKKHYVCTWKIGDVFALQISKDNTSKKLLNGKYFIFIKIGNYIDGKNAYPIIWVKITSESTLPMTISEINTLDFVQTNNYFLDKYPELLKNVKPVGNILHPKYYINKFGRLPFYNFTILGKSNEEIPTELIKLTLNTGEVIKLIKKPIDGNTLYDNEYNGNKSYWKNVEQTLIISYYVYNLDTPDAII